MRSLSLLPSAGVAVLSKFTCAACVSAYAGMLGSVGVGFVATDAGLMGLTVSLLALGLAAVAWSARRHRHLGPLVLMFVSSSAVLAARETQAPASVMIVTGGLVVAASLWNMWIERQTLRCCIGRDHPAMSEKSHL